MGSRTRNATQTCIHVKSFRIKATHIHLIWNDLSTTNSVLSFFLHSFFFLQEAARVAVEEAVTTIDHTDIRGSEPHNRDPSGAASD